MVHKVRFLDGVKTVFSSARFRLICYGTNTMELGVKSGTVFAGVTYKYPGFNTKNILMPEFHKVGIKIEKITAGGAIAFLAKKGDPSFAKYHMVSNNNKLKYVDLYHYIRSFYTGKYNKFRVNDIMGKIWTYYNRLCVDLTYNVIILYSYPQFKYNTKQSWVRFLC